MRLFPEQLLTQLQKGLSQFYWLSGDETLLMEEAVHSIGTAAKKAGFVERQILNVESGFDWQEFENQLSSLSLFGERTLIELRFSSLLFPEAAKLTLTHLAERAPADKILLIITPKMENKQLQTQWFKRLETFITFIAIKPLELKQWPRWVTERLRQAGLSTNSQGLEWLIACCEGNLLAAAQAIEKLSLDYGTGVINAQQIAAAIGDNSRFDLFTLADTMLAGETSKTWRILQRLQQENTEPVLLLWVLVRELRLLIAITQAYELRTSLEAVFAQHKVWEKRKSLLKNAAQRYSNLQFTLLLQYAAYLDKMLKGAIRGNVWQGLTTLALCLAGVSQLLHSLPNHDFY